MHAKKSDSILKYSCFVDETGQHTKGILFFVSLVILTGDLLPLRERLRDIERRSGNRYSKWTKSTIKQRTDYLKDVLSLKEFKGALFFAKFPNTTDYLSCTIDAIARGLNKKTTSPYKATILIDALNKHQRQDVAVKLRRQGVMLDKVRGLEDEGDAFIRLADTLAGLVRAADEGKAYAKALYDQALSSDILQEV